MEEAHLGGLHDKLSHELDTAGDNRAERFDIARRERSVYYQHRLNSNIATQHKVIAQAQKREDQKRLQLLEAGKEEKMFQKLRERKQERYLQDLDRRSQKETDEIGKNVFNRKSTP